MNALIAQIFPFIADRSHATPFVFFTVMILVQFFVALFVYPETKQRSLEQIQTQFGIH